MQGNQHQASKVLTPWCQPLGWAEWHRLAARGQSGQKETQTEAQSLRRLRKKGAFKRG